MPTRTKSRFICWIGKSAKRAETINIVDAASQALLSTESFSSFSGGIYETWNIKGHVQIKVVFTGGNNAVVAGVFFDTGGAAAPSATATYTGADTTTLGLWTGKYGADGQMIPNDLSKPPAYATVSLTGDLLWTWASPTSDTRGLQVASGSSTRIASTYYSNGFIIDLNLTDGNSHKVSLYLCDWDAGNRAETISIVDAATHAVLSSQNFSSFTGGIYESWTIKGHVQVQVIYQSGYNSIVNGIFFDTPSTNATPKVTLTANPASITAGGGSTLTWSSTNATSCVASGGWTGTQTTNGSTSVSPATTTSYTLSCTGPGGSSQASATVSVTSALAADWVYYNGQFNWPSDWSYAATTNYSSTAGAPLSGPYDLQVSTSTWGGWQPAAPNQALDLTPYKYVTFSLKPTIAGQTWSCYFTKTGATSTSNVVNVLNYGPAPVAGVWGTYSIPLADLGVSASSIESFAIQDQTGLASNSWYVDNVGFVQSIPPFYPPLVTLTASPTLFTSAGNTTLTWSSTNAASCLGSGGWSGSLPTTGTKSVPVASTNAYLLTCTGAGGSASASAGVTVTNPSAFSIQVSGNKLVNGSAKTVQLRGVNLSGMEFTAVDGYDPSDPTGGNFGQPNKPNWSAISSWKANIVRIPLNEDSWLGLTCTDTDGVVHNSDPGGNYKQTLANLVQEANAAGIYVILDLHWAAPGNACPMLQSQMADTDHSLAFWTSIANAYKGNPAVLFELFNEPFLDFDFTGDPWQYLMFGTGGSFSGYPATSNNGTWKNVMTPWNIASYQAMINAVRATGATNVVLIGSLSYTADLSGWLSHKPTDPLGQMAATWHPYPGGSTWGTPAWAQPSYAPEIFTEVQSILAAGIPVVATETGDQDTAGTVGAPLVQTVTTFADANGVSLLGWTWDVWNSSDFVLIKDVNGTPTDGYGVFFKAWMVNHP